MHRSQVEEMLGTPLREMRNEHGGSRCVYVIKVFYPQYGERAGLLAFDILTFGGLTVGYTLNCWINENMCFDEADSENMDRADLVDEELILVYDASETLISIETVTGEPLSAE